MRNTLLTTAAIMGLALAMPAMAQTPAPPASAQPMPAPAMPAMPSAAPESAPAAAPDVGTAPAQAAAPDQSAQTGTAQPPAGTHNNMMRRTHHMISANGADHWAHQPGTGQSGPASERATNIDSSDTHSKIAPHFPQPKVGENATPASYLQDAESALSRHRSGEADQALEMAETRLLDRSTPAADANQVDPNPAIQQVANARKALASGDMQAAHSAIQTALASASGEGGGQGGMSGGGMSSGSMAPALPQAGPSTGPSSMNNGGAMGTGAAPMSTSPGGAPGAAGAAPPVSAGAGGGPAGTPSNDSAGGAK